MSKHRVSRPIWTNIQSLSFKAEPICTLESCKKLCHEPTSGIDMDNCIHLVTQVTCRTYCDSSEESSSSNAEAWDKTGQSFLTSSHSHPPTFQIRSFLVNILVQIPTQFCQNILDKAGKRQPDAFMVKHAAQVLFFMQDKFEKGEIGHNRHFNSFHREAKPRIGKIAMFQCGIF